MRLEREPNREIVRRGELHFLSHAGSELFAIVDATEQAVQRSQDDEKQRAHYSGKKKRHTRKTAIVVNELGEIRGVTPSTPGSVHDITHVRGSGILDKIPKEVGVIGDAL